MTDKLAIPTIHLNGSGEGNLFAQYQAAMDALHEAIGAMIEMTPHARDYYTQEDPDAWTKAMAQHQERLRRVEDVRGEIEEFYLAVYKAAGTSATTFIVGGK